MSSPVLGSQRLRLAFDGTPLIGHRTGVGHVTASILGQLAERNDLDIVAFTISRTGRRDLTGQVPQGVSVGASALPARIAQRLWRTAGRPRIEHWSGTVDVVHATNYVVPPAAAPAIVTVHDVTFHRLPQLCSPDAPDIGTAVEVALHRGAVVHVFSDFVADEVRELYRLPSERIERVYPGLMPIIGGNAQVGRELAATNHYVLALGTVEPRKNLVRLVEAFDAVGAARPELHLVVAGPEGWDEGALAEAVRRSHHGDRIRRIGYLTERERAHLLAGARLLAYPSLYEGFGHPPLEAMSVGVPVVAARAGSLPEVLGDAALLPDPTDVDDLAAALASALDDEGLRAELIDRGRVRAAGFRWDDAAAELVTLYRRVALTAR